MLPNLPTYVSVVFGLTTLATFFLFYWTVKQSNSETTQKKATVILVALIGWLIIQMILTLNGVYIFEIPSIPPRIILFGVLPAMLTISSLFINVSGRRFIDSLPLVNVTYMNSVRVPVELVLWWLFLNKTVPELMTFEGRNLDILAGLTAPFIAYFGFTRGKLSRRLILVWNFICLALLLNIVVNALLAAPTPFQQFAFDQPNIAITYFPFSWLPTFVVPIVLFGHLVSIRQLTKQPTA